MSARTLALDLLLRCEAAGQYANLALDHALRRESGITGADKALCTALFYATIEHKITLDYIIDGASSIPPSAIEKRVRMILRMGLCQLLYFDRVPDHAAINETVDMTPKRSKGFVNAILRGFCRQNKEIVYPSATEEPIRYLSVRYSVPEELAKAFVSGYGLARAERILNAFDHVPALTVRVNTLRHGREDFIQRFGGEPTKIAPNGVRFADMSGIADAIATGECFVQDEASQICVAALDAAPGERVLDLCAAPGSKSFGAALMMRNAGVVRSYDLHENKISLIRRGAESLGLTNLTAAAGDARKATPETVGLFDRVLCDVPCSGYGVLAKKPDIRYKEFSLAAGLLPIQAAILEAAAACVQPGGVLVYSTCTLLPAENEEQITAFLKRHADFSLLPFSVGELCSDGMLTLTPDVHGTDGFFVAKLCKKR
ncbi:MAG: 16S rRNA (cytosine(967)-C(5))-methyltransferase RsmB [Ruminococcaceae bacterium]|nr:16S rRNA (cytosine(967)-C(5))-methyltransferase RsmB [Oscillospiraceae bacterium]